MLETKRVNALFTDARSLHSAALAQLEQGQLQKAAGKAWDATVKATDGLILARTGKEPADDRQTFTDILTLGVADPALKDLGFRYGSSCGLLFEHCFCDGVVDPPDDLISKIRETAGYIQDAIMLAKK